MDALFLARVQFTITTVYHFFFVPLTLGLSLLVAIMQTMYYRTNDEAWKKQTQFWGKLFLINFAMGVVTGIVQEFQFGMNWSEYSRFVGDIFGTPLAIEALLAFFLESTFLGLWFFGWDKLSKRAHLATIWLVAFASNLSALWILLANAFMQNPVGYVLRNGRAEMNDFFALATNPYIFTQYPHVFFSGLTTAGFFVLGISAWHLLRKSNVTFFRQSAQIGLIVALAGSVLVGVMGHAQGQHMVRTQPMKMAAAEALWNSENPAALSLIAFFDENARADSFAIRIPALLSFLSYNQFSGEVKGINQLQAEYAKQYGAGNYVPPIFLNFWSFRVMVGVGTLLALLALVGLFLMWQKKFEATRWLLVALPWTILLPYVANTAGWLLTELGRQPWIVFGLLKTENAVSKSVSGVEVLLTLILFTLTYGVLMVFDIYLLMKYAKRDPMEATQVGAY
ncbi:MAG: cytochrome ubiquinol oxidase subunit I [Anaerolineales bacterium]|nr:cytochrome ubiquinol oxidase subunit I [Anaerolineales bacterium]